MQAKVSRRTECDERGPLSAHVNLGYRGNVAKEAVDRVVDGAPEGLTLEVTLKRALKILAKQQ